MVGAGPRMGETYFYFFYFFIETIGLIEPLIWGKMCPQTNFLAFIQPAWSFLRIKFQNCIRYFISHRIGYIHFCRLMSHSWKNGHVTKNYFLRYVWKYCDFFFEKIVKWKIFKISFLTKKSSYWFLWPDTLFPSKWSCPPKNVFLQFFQRKLKNIHEVFLLESILIRKQMLRRINFILIKFLPNALFEKLQNECKNSSFLHKVTRVRLDQAGTVIKFHIHGF